MHKIKLSRQVVVNYEKTIQVKNFATNKLQSVFKYAQLFWIIYEDTQRQPEEPSLFIVGNSLLHSATMECSFHCWEVRVSVQAVKRLGLVSRVCTSLHRDRDRATNRFISDYAPLIDLNKQPEFPPALGNQAIRRLRVKRGGVLLVSCIPGINSSL